MYDFSNPIYELFIIGNGFDIAHDLPTSYWDFRSFLEKIDENFLVEFERLFGFEPLSDEHYRSVKVLREAQEKRDSHINEMLWKAFEYNLGNMDDQQILDFSSCIVDDLNLETGTEGILDTMNAYWKDQYSFITDLQQYLELWVKSIDITNAPVKREDLLESCDYFLTFNYNLLLESIYNIDSFNILHIHGSIDDGDESPVIGHGNYEKIEKFDKIIEEASNSFDEASESIYSALVDMYTETLKDTNKYILQNQHFFNKLTNVAYVSVIGHSFGEVDYPYFETVKDSVSSACKWKFYCYSKADEEACMNFITKLHLDESQYVICDSSIFWD